LTHIALKRDNNTGFLRYENNKDVGEPMKKLLSISPVKIYIACGLSLVMTLGDLLASTGESNAVR